MGSEKARRVGHSADSAHARVVRSSTETCDHVTTTTPARSVLLRLERVRVRVAASTCAVVGLDVLDAKTPVRLALVRFTIGARIVAGAAEEPDALDRDLAFDLEQSAN